MTEGHVNGAPAALQTAVAANWWQPDIPTGHLLERFAAPVPCAALLDSVVNLPEGERQ